ncbi:MAG: DUF2171 domain-containing protein [Chloroflexi bacterium]|nr:DUF2171 domain-containing protein [Chloroflexota bacterium]
MERKRRVETGEETIREGHVVIDEDLVDGEGRVEYVGTTGEAVGDRPLTPPAAVETTTARDRLDAPAATTGSMIDPVESQVINQIREGMRVVDVTGEELGKVEYVQMGDPDAVTVQDNSPGEPGDLIRGFLGVGEPDVPEPLRSRLLRFGYVKIDGPGWIDTDRYVTADLIQGISGDTVTLKVDKDRVMAEM